MGERGKYVLCAEQKRLFIFIFIFWSVFRHRQRSLSYEFCLQAFTPFIVGRRKMDVSFTTVKTDEVRVGSFFGLTLRTLLQWTPAKQSKLSDKEFAFVCLLFCFVFCLTMKTCSNGDVNCKTVSLSNVGTRCNGSIRVPTLR